MSVKITTFVLFLGLCQLASCSFFGLFSSPSPTRAPDVIVSESPKSESDKSAYENYLRSLASTYNASANSLPPPPPPVQYLPVYTYRPQIYANYIQPQQSLIYHTAPRILKTAPITLHYSYEPINSSSVDLPNVKLSRPIIVLPSSSFDKSSISAPDVGSNNYNKLIEESTAPISQTEFEVPEPQLSASLYDLPVSGISPDFLTGGYITKTMTSSSSDNNIRLGRKFGHAYDNRDGTKVSEEGQLVQNGIGKETVLKRGQYEYVDANGKTVLVKWIADDNGFRLVN